jgi:RNA polymerase-binding transcription factor DksA
MKTQTTNADADVPANWRWFYHRLRFLRDRLMEARVALVSIVSESVEPSLLELGESASAEIERDLAMDLLEREEDALFEIDAAIHRILHGGYGICEDTGTPIPEARLRAVPWTRYSLAAEERIEAAHQTSHPIRM